VDTYYVRHTEKLDIDDSTREKLWKEQRIAIHFPQYRNGKSPNGKIPRGKPDNPSLSVEDYPRNARGAIHALTDLAANGGYVCAQYFRHTECLLGYVRPKSKIELIRGEWGSGWLGRRAILKSLRLRRVKLVNPADLAVIQVGRPQQGTIMRWRKAGKSIEEAVEGNYAKRSLDILWPEQQEIMCSEFLRLSEPDRLGLPRLAYLLLPPGRTMKDIDICGISESGRMILAQVTHKEFEQCSSKVEALQRYHDGRRNILILFCRCTCIGHANGITIVPLQQIYDTFTMVPKGKVWLNRSTQLHLQRGVLQTRRPCP